METLALLLLSFLCTYTPSHGAICPPTSCRPGGPAVRFPFQLLNRQDYRCGFRGFDLSCDSQNQTILNLPNAGDFTVNRIDYANQWIFINDPDYCLPKRILNFTLSGSQFTGVNLRNFTFYNCSNDPYGYGYRSVPIYCLSTNRNYTVVATNDAPYTCQNMLTVPVPVQSDYPYRETMDLNQDLLLTWREPNCRACEGDGGICAFKDDSRKKIGCFDLPRRRAFAGLPRSAKYGIIIGVGIPGLVSLMGLGCYISGRIKSCGQRRQHDVELANSEIAPPPAVIMTGLDWRTIESYPKTVLGESRQLPNPNDVTCPICLAEYQPKDTLRTIPECNHYFHATCVDEWLKLNATCPLCRKSPAESSVVTPSSSMSLTPSSSSSSSAT